MPTTAASYDGMTWCLLANSCAHSTDGTRRRVHSPSWATSSRVTSLTAVRGSTNPSTPRRVVDELAQVLVVGASEAPTVVEPVRRAPVGRRIASGAGGPVERTPWASVAASGTRRVGRVDTCATRVSTS